MPVDRSILGLLLETKTTGTQEIEKLEAALNKVVSISERSAQRATAATQRSTEGLQRQFAQFRQVVQAPLESAGEAAESFALRFGKVGLVAAGVAVGVGVVAKQLFDMVSAAGAAAEQSVNLADTLGITIGRAEQLQAQAKIAGVEVGGFTAAARILSETLANPTSAAAQKAERALAKLGVSTQGAGGDQRDLGAVLVETLDRLAKVENSAQRVALAQAVLGRGAAGLQPLIKNLDELKKATDALGVGLDENGTKKLAEFDDAIDKADVAFTLFKKSISAKIAAIVIPIVASITDSKGNTLSVKDLEKLGVGLGRFAKPDSREIEQAGGRIFAGLQAREGRSQSILLQQQAELAALAELDKGRAAQLVDEFKRRTSGTEDARQRRLADLQKQQKELEDRIRDRRGTVASLTSDIQQFDANASEIRQIERTNELLAEQKRLRDQNNAALRELRIAQGTEPESAQKAIERLTKQVREGIPTVPSAINNTLDFGIPGGLPGSILKDLGNIPDFAKAAEDALGRLNERRVDAVKRALDFQTRLVELTAGPGGELAAVERITQLRLDAAQKEFEITGDRARLEAEIEQTERQRTLQRLELEKQRLDRYKNAAGRTFDALVSRGGSFSIGDVLQQQLLTNVRQISVNASAGIFRSVGSTLGRVGRASGLGSLLSGTLFDPANAEDATQENTTATERNTIAMNRVSAALRGGVGGALGVGDLPTLARDPLGALGIFGSDIGGLTGGRSVIPGLGKLTSNAKAQQFLQGLNVFNGGLFSPRGTEIITPSGLVLNLPATGAQRIGNFVGSGAAIAAGTAGIVSGIRAGGAQGVTSAVASGLGIAATIPGPQQPFIAAAAAVAGLVSMFLGDPKELRDRLIEETIRSRRFDPPTRITEELNIADGRSSAGYDFRGNLRFVNVNINAMDAKSFLDRSREIGQAVTKQIMGGDARLADSLRTAVLTG